MPPIRPPLVRAMAGGVKKEARRIVPATSNCLTLFLGRKMFSILKKKALIRTRRRMEGEERDSGASSLDRSKKRFKDVVAVVVAELTLIGFVVGSNTNGDFFIICCLTAKG